MIANRAQTSLDYTQSCSIRIYTQLNESISIQNDARSEVFELKLNSLMMQVTVVSYHPASSQIGLRVKLKVSE
jgi:hypothetical protein